MRYTYLHSSLQNQVACCIWYMDQLTLYPGNVSIKETQKLLLFMQTVSMDPMAPSTSTIITCVVTTERHMTACKLQLTPLNMCCVARGSNMDLW